MRIPDDEMHLRPQDEVKQSEWGGLVVERTIELTICRCRQCKDRCVRLSEPPHLLCVHCHNNHTQNVDGVYRGPFSGPR